MIRTMLESVAILQTRLVLGDECVSKMAMNIPTRTRGRLMQRHPNQTAGIIQNS